MHVSPGMRWVLRIGTAVALAFIYIPLIVIAIYAFNQSRSQAWPVDGLTLDWFDKALHNPGVREAFWTSVKAGLGATAVALLLGTLASIAVSRYRFFGRDTISFLIILPLAFPAVVAGSIFTFSLTLGDYITPQLVSSTQFIGNVVYANVGIANNLPLAAAFATVPVAIMIVYLLIARRLGAFESL